MAEAIIEIPAVLDGVRTGNVRRVEGLARILVTKYGGERRRPSCSLEFDRHGVLEAARDKGWYDRLLPQDLAITVLMNSKVSTDDVEALLGRKDVIENALKVVPKDVDLFGPVSAEAWGKVKGLFGAMEVHGIGLAKMTKVLYLKRPRLIPMLDSYLMEALYAKEWPDVDEDTYAEAGVAAMKTLAALYFHGENAAAVDVATSGINEWLRTSGEAVPVQITPVRVLESVLWYEIGGKSNFE